MHPPYTPQALLEDMKMLEDEFGLAEMATPERDDDPNSLNGDFHDPRDPMTPTPPPPVLVHIHHTPQTLSQLSRSLTPRTKPPVGPPAESSCVSPSIPSPRVARSAGRCPRCP